VLKASDQPPEEDRGESVSRMTLRQVLLTGVDDAVQFDKVFSHYEQHPDGKVTAFFQDGTSATGDVLVAADGSNSRVRRQYLPHAKLARRSLELLDELAQPSLGLCAREALPRSRRAPLPQPAPHLPGFDADLRVPGLAAGGIGADDQRPGAVRAARHDRIVAGLGVRSDRPRVLLSANSEERGGHGVDPA
jgi:hypothetical protein